MRKYTLIALAAMVAFGSMNICATQNDSEIKFSEKAYIMPVLDIAFGVLFCATSPIYAWEKSKDSLYYCTKLQNIKENTDLDSAKQKDIDSAIKEFKTNEHDLRIFSVGGFITGLGFISKGWYRIKRLRLRRSIEKNKQLVKDALARKQAKVADSE